MFKIELDSDLEGDYEVSESALNNNANHYDRTEEVREHIVQVHT